MTTKELLKKEIDELPDELLMELQQIIQKFKAKKEIHKCNKPTLHLKGAFDNINIRQKAYE